MVKVEDLGPDFSIEDDGLMATSARSGDAIRLGDRLMVEVSDVAILRRTVYARRMRGDGHAFVPDRNRENGRGRKFGGHSKPARDGKSDNRPAFGSRDPTGKKARAAASGRGGKRDDRGRGSSGGAGGGGGGPPKGKKPFGGARKGKKAFGGGRKGKRR
jgi:ribonuclease R